MAIRIAKSRRNVSKKRAPTNSANKSEKREFRDKLLSQFQSFRSDLPPVSAARHSTGQQV